MYNIEELYLDHNHVSSIRSEDFGYAGTEDEALPYLRKLGLSHNRIKTFEEVPFRFVLSFCSLLITIQNCDYKIEECENGQIFRYCR